MKKLLAAPFNLHRKMLTLVETETTNARRGLPARIIAKMNALADREMIEALYRASQAGVQTQLIIRGICCLRPGVPGLSENITVKSIVGRFLEHSRIFYFENACQPKVYIGSADWMPRNFFHRIETVFPIEDGVLRDRVINEILAGCLTDGAKSRFLQPDGSYQRPPSDDPQVNCQQDFMRLAAATFFHSQSQNREAPLSLPMKVRRQPGHPPA